MDFQQKLEKKLYYKIKFDKTRNKDTFFTLKQTLIFSRILL